MSGENGQVEERAVDVVARDSAPASRRRWSRRASFAAGTAGIALLALGALWVQRAPIAENLINRELAARDVQMRYRVAAIGPRTQRIENVVLGDPLRPDLTARWIEVDIAFGGLTPRVAHVRAGGVRLRGRYQDGKLSLGELDKFLGGGESVETTLPDITLSLSDARAAILTDYGALGLEVDGAGHLRDGFAGRVVAASPLLGGQGCEATAVVAILRVAVNDGSPHISGPVRGQDLDCADAGVALVRPDGAIDLRLADDLNSVDGSATLSARTLRAAGMTLARPKARVTLAMDKGGLTGRALVRSAAVSGKGVAARGGTLDGGFSRQGADGPLAVEARLTLDDLSATRGNPLFAAASRLAGTPFGPLAAKLANAVERAGTGNRLLVAGQLAADAATRRLVLDEARFEAASGARIALDSGGRAAIDLVRGRWTLDGALTMEGGDLPAARLRLAARPGGGVEGDLQIAPYEARGGRLALQPVRFRQDGEGAIRIETVAAIDGPLSDGGVRGLILPVDLRLSADGDVLLNPACAQARWDEVRLSNFSVVNGGAMLCPRGGGVFRLTDGRTGGGIETNRMALNGRIGSSSIALKAAGAGFDIASGAFSGQGVDVRIGSGPSPVILRASSLAGRSSSGTLGGRFAAGSARIGSVPFDMSELDGTWRYSGGALDVTGAMRIADTAADARFNPLRSEDVRLTLKANRITAGGSLRHPVRGEPFAKVAIGHDLGSGAGSADVRLTDLRFGSVLQPDDLTPLATGVVANVDGGVEGEAAVRWDAGGVTASTGTFSTSGMDLAAAFGPVQDLATTLRFTDLLAIESAPGQVVTLGSVNPGIEAREGRIRYQLLRDQRVRIEGGEWPFSGGTLSLLPETLDMGSERERRLTFRVVGMDAGAFINTLELENISATGSYDGLLPMVFDANGGRIANGILVARQEGLPPLIVTDARTLTVPCDPMRQAGTLSYVGQVSNAKMNMFGKLAFDALKNLRYRCLTILLDGAIDGEFLTRIAINGVNQGSIEARQSALARPFLGLPFLFNVRIEAPFRGLLNTYQSFTDPTTLIRNSVDQRLQSVLDAGRDVQPVESETMPVSEGE